MNRKKEYSKPVLQKVNNSIDDLIKSAVQLRQENAAKSIELSKQALEQSEKKGYKKGAAECHYNLGIAYFNQSNFAAALDHLHKASDYYSVLNMKKQMAESLNASGVVNKSKGSMDGSLDAHMKALKIFEEIDDKKGMASANNNLGVLYKVQGEFNKALQYFEKALEINNKAKETSGLIMVLGNIANIHRQTGNDSKAIEYNKKALQIAEETGDKKNLSLLTNNIGLVYEKQGKYDDALKYFMKSVMLKESIGDTKGIASTYSNIGNLYRAKGDQNNAVKYQKIALDLIANSNAKPLEKDIYKEISQSYAKIGDYEEAYKNHLKFFQLHDELFSQEARNRLNELVTGYETEKSRREAEIFKLRNVELKKRNDKIQKQSKVIAEEKRKSDELLLNILPAEVAEELKKNAKVAPRKYKQVTVLFTDFKGFTEQAEKLSAEELVSELDMIFGAFDRILPKYNVEKIKTIGDSYMCAGGLPTPNKTNAVDVVKAAIEMLEFLNKLKKERQKKKQHFFDVRIGIHTGPVVAGVVGTKKFAYDIWGDTVNTASRMESSGEPGKINISGATYELVKKKFKCTSRGKVKAKGKGEVEMYFVEVK
ncbi:MAG: Photosystem I assembly protein Ycf3 [Bacteroidia bacterium]|nr:Photosystem I assembly protein Ycf3 [Bacteroidia bacterium]